MNELPVELLLEIFDHLSDPTSLVEVSPFIRDVVTTQIRKIHLKLADESVDRLLMMKNVLGEFRGLKKIRLEITKDVNNQEKAAFYQEFYEKVAKLSLKDMTFLNLYFGSQITSTLESLSLIKCDLSTSSQDISQFVINSCPNLKSLTIDECSGMEMDSLNYIGENLHRTKIEHLNLMPSYVYFDVLHQHIHPHWSIEKLKTLSIRTKFTIVQKNFMLKLLGKQSDVLETLELIVEMEFDQNLTSIIVNKFPNLKRLSIGKGCNIIKNEDFVTICNSYQNLKAFEFHFNHNEKNFDTRGMRTNKSITELTLGITLPITAENLKKVGECLPNVTHLNIVRYHPPSTSSQDFLNDITQAFPRISFLEFQRTGSNENIKFSAMKEKLVSEINDMNIRNLNEIKKSRPSSTSPVTF